MSMNLSQDLKGKEELPSEAVLYHSYHCIVRSNKFIVHFSRVNKFIAYITVRINKFIITNFGLHSTL